MEFVQKLLSTRGGTIALGGVAAVMAALVLLLYLNQYRSSVAAESEDVTVLVAKNLIEKGMPGDVVGLKRLFESEQAPQSQVRDGAITDPSTLRGRVAVEDVYPGQQLTIADFAVSTNAIGAKLAGKYRAVAVPVDSAHGLVGTVEPGDRVDVHASFEYPPNGSNAEPVVTVIMQNALVLDVPAETAGGVATGNQTTEVVVRFTRDRAAEVAWAADNGNVWLVLRPRAGAAPTKKPRVVNARALLRGRS